MDAVYLVREGDNPELRYSLRSLRNVAHDQVWIVGYKPAWVTGVEHLSLRQGKDRYANTLAAVHTACTHADISDDFQLWNDDFYALEPAEIPVWHLGPVKPVGRSRHQGGRAATFHMLTSWGVDPVYDYSVHVPMVINQEKMVEALRRAAPHGLRTLHRRTLYGNLYQIGGVQVRDVAIGGTPRNATFKPGQTWVSTTDSSFATDRVGRDIRTLFPDPSPYEKD